MIVSALVQLVNHSPWWFIQNVNLVFHEAGHVFLMFFGQTLQTLGGSLFEVGIPLLVTLYFYVKQHHLSSAFGAWWLSTAFISVSVYVTDAREQALPLLGGSAVSHDWHTLLGWWGLLQYDDLFGYVFWLASFGTILLIVRLVMHDNDVMMLVSKYLKHETNIT